MAIQFLEKDLEDIIYNTDNKKLSTHGLPIYGKKTRQLRIGNYGIADIVSIHRTQIWDEGIQKYDPCLMINVFELKQKKIDANTMMQSFRYRAGIERYVNEFREKDINLNISNVLIGKEVCMGDFCYLTDRIPGLKVYTYHFDIDGLKFKRVGGYSLIEEGFKN